MAAGKRMPLAEAESLARSLVELLRPACERIEIGGSIRRKRPTISDIEVIAIAKMATEPAGLYDTKEVSELDRATDKLRTHGPGLTLAKIKGAEKYQQFNVLLDDKFICHLDLFITVPEQWGCIYLIRTGSADWIHKLVTKRKFGGSCPEHIEFRGGRMVKDGRYLDTPEEAKVFQALGKPWVPPEKRE